MAFRYHSLYLALLLPLVGCTTTTLSTPRFMPVPSVAPTLAAATLNPNAQGVINTFWGTGVAGLGEDGKPATQSTLYLPQDLTFGPDGLPYILDWNNHRVRRVNADSTVQTIAGIGELGDGPPGPALAASFNHPTNIAFDSQGRLVMAAWHNSRVVRVILSTLTLEYLCGTGGRSFGGDGGPCTRAIFDLPSSVVFDSAGNMLVSDQANQRIRRVDTAGNISTIAGTGKAGFSGDGGPATAAQLSNPVGQAADPSGRISIDANDNVYIADSGNNRIRKLSLKTGIITTVAGTGPAGFSGDGGPATSAQLKGPRDVQITADGTFYIADTFNSCVRKVDPAGTITTVAGTCGKGGFDGDGGLATKAKVDRPYGLTVGPDNKLYLADTHNQRVRVVNL